MQTDLADTETPATTESQLQLPSLFFKTTSPAVSGVTIDVDEAMKDWNHRVQEKIKLMKRH